MRVISILLLIAAFGFLIYAGIAKYPNTPADQGFMKRMWIAVMAAAAGITASALSLIHSLSAP